MRRPILLTVMVANLTIVALVGTACGSPSGTQASRGPGAGAGSGPSEGSCRYLTSSDFSAIGKTLAGRPIFNHESAVQVQDCYYDLGDTNDLVYLDFFDTSSAGQQNYTNSTDPSAGNGTPVAVSGVGDSAYWLVSGDTLFARKGSVVFQLKVQESGRTPAQLQADATTLAAKVAARIG